MQATNYGNILEDTTTTYTSVLSFPVLTAKVWRSRIQVYKYRGMVQLQQKVVETPLTNQPLNISLRLTILLTSVISVMVFQLKLQLKLLVLTFSSYS